MNGLRMLGGVAGAAILAMSGLLVPVTGAGAAAPPPCRNADLKASYHAADSATSHRFGRIVLKNVSGHRCTTGGFGGLSYVGHGDGTQIGAAADRVGTAKTLVLVPGARAASLVDETVADVYPRHTCRPRHVDGFRVYVPNATRSQFVVHPTRGCANPDVHLISHRAYRLR